MPVDNSKINEYLDDHAPTDSALDMVMYWASIEAHASTECLTARAIMRTGQDTP